MEVVEKVEKGECSSLASQQTSAHPAHPLLVPQKFKIESSIPLALFNAPDQQTASHPPVVKMEPFIIDLTISDSDGDTHPVTMPVMRKRSRSLNFSSPSLSMPSSPASSNSERRSGADNSDDGVCAWPSSFYVIDIVCGFEKCEAATRGQKSVRETFIKCFQVPFQLSRRISLSPFRPPDIIPDLLDLTTLSHYLSFSSKSLNHSVHPFRPLRQHLHPSLSFLASPFPSVVLRFYPHPVSTLMFPFSLCTPFLSIILCFCLYTISIRPFTVSGRPVSWTVFQL